MKEKKLPKPGEIWKYKTISYFAGELILIVGPYKNGYRFVPVKIERFKDVGPVYWEFLERIEFVQ
jgi:hypothetical protein